jgi:hypothetical protein
MKWIKYTKLRPAEGDTVLVLDMMASVPSPIVATYYKDMNFHFKDDFKPLVFVVGSTYWCPIPKKPKTKIETKNYRVMFYREQDDRSHLVNRRFATKKEAQEFVDKEFSKCKWDIYEILSFNKPSRGNNGTTAKD